MSPKNVSHEKNRPSDFSKDIMETFFKYIFFCFVEIAREASDGTFSAEVRQRGAGTGTSQ